jgi:ubiquinone/menaquinone biosynthesis C-methylase UbiE
MTDFLKHRVDPSDPDIASVFDELSFWSSRFGHLLFKHIEIRRGLKILDLGCGTGFPLFELAHVFGSSCKVTGIDIWKEALERARLKLKTYDPPNVEIIEADGARQPFPDSEFDLIVSNLGVNNFADPQAVFSECFRVAKPDARIVLTTNLKGHYRKFYDVFRDTLREMNKTEHLERLSANEDHRGTKESIGDTLRKSGWNVVKIIEDQFYTRFQDGSALLNHHLTRLGFLDGWRSVVGPEDETEVFRMIEKKLNDTAQETGELRMTIPMLYLEGKKSGGK